MINMVFPGQILVNKDSKIFHRLFTLQRDILIFIIIKYRDIWLKSEFSLSWAKYDEVGFFDIQGKFICREPVTQFAKLQVYNVLSSDLRLLSAYRIFVSSANKKKLKLFRIFLDIVNINEKKQWTQGRTLCNTKSNILFRRDKRTNLSCRCSIF